MHITEQTITAGNLMATVKALPREQQQEVFLFVQELQKASQLNISPEIQAAHLADVKESIAEVQANPGSEVDAFAWLANETKKRGW